MGEHETSEAEYHEPEKFEAPEPAELTELLEGYEVEDLIACGGMGAVYLATQISLQRQVAIKVLPRELSQVAEFEKSFKAEARAMAKLTHAHLVGVYDFGEVDGMLYLVMEFIDGESLFDAANGHVVDPLQAMEIVQAIAAGLGHAHRAGVIHRDIKLANILISQSLDPKLGDFGLAVPSDDVESGMMMATPGYIAPEMMRGFGNASPASDVFALGVILHQLLTGVVPSGEDPADITLVPNLRGLQEIVRKATASNLHMRYKDGDEMAKALDEWLVEARKIPAHIMTAANRPGAISPLGSALGRRAPQPIPVTSSSGRGIGMMVALGLVAVLAIGIIIFAVTKSGKNGAAAGDPGKATPNAPAFPSYNPDPDPGPGAKPKPVDPPKPKPKPKPTPPTFVLTEHKAEVRKALAKARDNLLEGRRAHRRTFETRIATDSAWAPYRRLIDGDRHELPRFLLKGETVPLTATMIEDLEQFAIIAQRDHDESHLKTIKKLHRESVGALKEAEALPEQDIRRDWEAWAEWLGEDPMKIVALEPSGRWRLSQGDEPGTVLVIDRDGAVTLIRNEVEFKGGAEGMTRSTTGELTITHTPQDPSRHWRLRWRGGYLMGENEAGQEVVFRRDSYRFKATDPDPGPRPGPGAPVGEDELQDKNLADLRGKFRAALKRDLEPLVVSYRRVLKAEADRAAKRNNARAVGQLEAEAEWLEKLTWQTGRLFPGELKSPHDVPLNVQGQKSKFQNALAKKMSKWQGVYVEQLNKLKREYVASGSVTTEVDLELDLHLNPPGTVRGRYVKLQSEWVEGTNHATIAELTFLDADGKAVPLHKLRGHSASSVHEDSGPERAVDGDRNSIWHSKWKEPAAPFPHWIVIDLGEVRVLSGFRLQGRAGDNMRHTDILKWRLFMSDDATNWKEVADGNFRKTGSVQEALFSQ